MATLSTSVITGPRAARYRRQLVLVAFQTASGPLTAAEAFERVRRHCTRGQVDSAIAILRKAGALETAVQSTGGHQSNYYAIPSRDAAERKVG